MKQAYFASKMSFCIACLFGLDRYVGDSVWSAKVVNQACNTVFKTVKCKLTHKVVGQVECVLESSDHHKVCDLLVSLQKQVAKLMPHATRPSLCLLLFVKDVILTGPGFVFLPRVSRREACAAFKALSVSACIEAMWNEDDSKVLQKVSRMKGYSAIPVPEYKALYVSGASDNKAVIPELQVFAWQHVVSSLSVTLPDRKRLGDTSIFPDLNELRLHYRIEPNVDDDDIPMLSTQSTRELLGSSRLETIFTEFEISLKELSQLSRLTSLECVLTEQVQINLGLMSNLVKLTLHRTRDARLELSDCISNLSKLETLSLHGSGIGGAVDSVCKLPKLRQLYFYGTSCIGCLDDLLLLQSFEKLRIPYDSPLNINNTAFLQAGFLRNDNMAGFNMTKQSNNHL